MEQKEILEELCQTIIDGEEELAERWARKALEKGVDPLLAIEQGIRKGLEIIDSAFRRQEVFLPELVMAGDAAMASSAILEKEVEKSIVKGHHIGVMVIGTVAGDIHEIGKTLVATLFKVASFTVIDLGVDVPLERFIEAVRQYQPHILGLSSLLTTTLKQQLIVVEGLEREGLRSKVKVMVGGGVVTQEWADKIGADAYGEDAMEAVEIGKKLVELSRTTEA